MLCDKYKEALIEAAANAAGLPNLVREHVEGCTRCTETLAVQVRLFAAMEEELRSRANLMVPPNFDHRVRGALLAVPSPKRRRYLSGFTLASMAAAAAVLMAILFTQNLRRIGKETAVNSVVEPKPLARSLPPVPGGNTRSLEPSSPRRLYLRDGNVLKRLNAFKVVAGRKTDAEVLVPKGQEELLAKYLEGIAARKTRVTFSADLQHEPNMKPVEVPSIEISELVVKPLSDLSSN